MGEPGSGTEEVPAELPAVVGRAGEELPASQGGLQIATGEGQPASHGGSQITGESQERTLTQDEVNAEMWD